ncbi:acyltransferase [Pseudomonas piscis]|uniref:Acyltransferase n=1 Tax=Pseudomonas piscis TaxID=2614538 RepID=A0ABY9ND21_9PSED|nr:acyltransferase [Pseudomonas piscis]WMN15643.1 acyltransferase [Pseudomonas piscis]
MINNKERINEIDLYRFIAAISVMIFHYAFRGSAYDDLSVMSYPLLIPVAKYGYLGVQFFFMISGFVIFMTATNATLKSFIRSRAIRLYPAFWACCTLTFITILIAEDPRFTATLRQYLSNMTMFSGFMHQPSIDGAYWSIFTEIRFYLLISVILILKKMKQAEYFMLAWLLYTAKTFIVGTDKLSTPLISEYAVYFIAGASLYLVRDSGLTKLRIANLSGSFSLCLYQALHQAEIFEPTFKSELNEVVISIIVICFFIAMGLSATRKAGLIGKIDWSTIGAMTYPLYLLHQFIGYIIFNKLYSKIDTHLLFFGTVALMLCASYLINKFIEVPLSAKLREVTFRANPRTI